MGVRDTLTGQLYLALKDLVAETLRSGDHEAIAFVRAEAALKAFETNDPNGLLDCSPASRARPLTNEYMNIIRVGTKENENGKGQLARDEAIFEERKIEPPPQAESASELALVYGHFLSLLPTQTRVNREPGKGAARAIGRALKERPVNVLIDALNGAREQYGTSGSRFRVETIFGTFRGTGSLAERIDWLASRAPHKTSLANVEIPQSILDRVGVRERLHDAQREIRAALDSRTDAATLSRAARAERWLHEQGLVVVLGELNDRGARKFAIGAGPVPENGGVWRGF